MESKFREFLISSLKRLDYEVEFLQSVVVENESINTLDSTDDFVLQLGRVKNEIKALLDYNFYSDEVENTEMWKIEVKVIQE